MKAKTSRIHSELECINSSYSANDTTALNTAILERCPDATSKLRNFVALDDSEIIDTL